MIKILVVDDEASIRKAIVFSLSADDCSVLEADSVSKAIEKLTSNQFEIVITDLYVPEESDGLQIIKSAKQNHPDAKVIVMSAHGTIDHAVNAMKIGADDFIPKGFTIEELNFRIRKLLDYKNLETENLQLNENLNRLKKEVEDRYNFANIIGKSKTMLDLFSLLRRIVDDYQSTVLIQGESGTGKELIARAIHYNGPRKDKPFIAVNCSVLPEHLLESELFGYEKGAFTGAMQSKPGKFEIAHTGTIFIDEVAELSPKVQVQLLRFIQERTFERLGGNEIINVDVRIITASNKNLTTEVKEGRFRSDLFYRLNVIPINVPPLRERKEDIPALCDHFISKHGISKNKNIRLMPAAIKKLLTYEWPGNVRELENLIERLLVTSINPDILPADLPEEFTDNFEKADFENVIPTQTWKEAIKVFEKSFLIRALDKYHWNITDTAEALGERRDTLSKKIARYGLKHHE